MLKKSLINLDPIRNEIRTKLLEQYDTTTFMNTDTVSLKVDVKDLLEQYIEAKNIIEPTIYITADAYIKMRKLVEATETEIGWYGTVEEVPGLQRTYIINDIIVYPQHVTGATCEQDDDRMFDFEMSLTNEQVNHKRFHGHSHVNMGVTPSSVDENFYQDLLTQVTDYFIITITNKRHDYTVRFYDIENNILYSDLPILLLTEQGQDINFWYSDVIKQVVKPTPVVTEPSRIVVPQKTGYYSHIDDEEKPKSKWTSPYDDLVYDDEYSYIFPEKKDWFDKKKEELQKGKGKRGRKPGKR